MKKVFLSAVIALVTLGGFNASAQNKNENNNAAPAAKTATCDKKEKCCKANLFEGITLTPEQQTKIDNLRKQQVENVKAAKQKAKTEKKQAREQKMQARKAQKKARLAEMKQILTPEQYVVYLENIVISQPNRQGMRPGHHDKGMHKDKKNMKNGERKGNRYGQKPAENK